MRAVPWLLRGHIRGFPSGPLGLDATCITNSFEILVQKITYVDAVKLVVNDSFDIFKIVNRPFNCVFKEATT